MKKVSLGSTEIYVVGAAICERFPEDRQKPAFYNSRQCLTIVKRRENLLAESHAYRKPEVFRSLEVGTAREEKDSVSEALFFSI